MQARKMVAGKPFGYRRIGGSLIALALVAALAIGIMLKLHQHESAGSEAESASVGRPMTYWFKDQGEGLLGNPMLSAAPKLPAHDGAGQGEGLLEIHASVAAPKAYDAPGLGEGWVALGRPRAAPAINTAEGLGEGRLAHGHP